MWRCTGCKTENQDAAFFCSWCACHRSVDAPVRGDSADVTGLSSPPELGIEFCLWRPPIDPETGLVVIRTCKRGVLGLFLYTMLPLGIGLMFLLFAKPGVRTVSLPIGLFFLLMAGLPGGYLLRLFLRAKIAIVLDQSGIVINTSPLSSGRVLWVDISKGELVVRKGGAYIGLDVRDRTKYRVSRFNLLFNRYPFVITDWAVGDSLTGLWVYVRRIIEDPRLAEELGTFAFHQGPGSHGAGTPQA
jgi:hypothetical protein